jgi:uncharacterized membrane protein
MELINRLQHFTPLDGFAIGFLWLCWALIGWRIEHPAKSRPSTSRLMAQYRRDWMTQMVTREPRIFDASILDTLRQGITFYASACLITLGGGIALLGNTERLLGVAADLTLMPVPAIIWEVKILTVLLIITSAMLKFIWAHRLFGYCAVIMASVPNNIEDASTMPRARQAAEINITATRAFNRGLRSLYFALAAMTWLLGPEALLIATLVTVFVTWRREFASLSRRILLGELP